jgi:integrase
MIAIRDALTQYVALRRALGTKFDEPSRSLGQFLDFLEREGSDVITTDLALRWATQPVNVQRATWARRLVMVRRFALWLSTIDPRTQVPPPRLLGGWQRRNRPHIYTEEEIRRLMAEAARITSPAGLRAMTYVTLIGLLSSTGLRPGEAIALDRSDVNPDAGMLSIRESKFGKSRFVPIDESVRLALIDYSTQRDRLCSQATTPAFLISESGRRLQGCAVRRTFARISCAIGIRLPADGRRRCRGPRLQDFRHTFATRRLIEWYRAGLEVGRELPKLATYLGHINIAATYWYLDAVPELLALATNRLSVRHSGGQE